MTGSRSRLQWVCLRSQTQIDSSALFERTKRLTGIDFEGEDIPRSSQGPIPTISPGDDVDQIEHQPWEVRGREAARGSVSRPPPLLFGGVVG